MFWTFNALYIEDLCARARSYRTYSTRSASFICDILTGSFFEGGRNRGIRIGENGLILVLFRSSSDDFKKTGEHRKRYYRTLTVWWIRDISTFGRDVEGAVRRGDGDGGSSKAEILMVDAKQPQL